VEELEVELPETLIQQTIRALIEQTASQVAQQGMDIKSLFTPELVRSLMESSRPEAELRLKRNLALQALATAEQIEVEAGAIDAKLKEVSSGLKQQESIDPARLRAALAEDLLRNKLLDWLEEHSTVNEKAPDLAADGPDDGQPASGEG